MNRFQKSLIMTDHQKRAIISAQTSLDRLDRYPWVPHVKPVYLWNDEKVHEVVLDSLQQKCLDAIHALVEIFIGIKSINKRGNT